VGRHQSDPHGTGRYVAVGGGIVLLVALLVIGGIALYGSLTSKNVGNTPPARPTTVGGAATPMPGQLPVFTAFVPYSTPRSACS
jgi:hypothetical protein